MALPSTVLVDALGVSHAPGIVLGLANSLTDVGAAALVDEWPLLVTAAWFCAGFLLVALPGWFLLVPAARRIVGRRNRNNATLEEAISRYLQLAVLVVAVYVGFASTGFTGFLTDSALVVAAATLALGVAAQSVIGSLVSGTVLVIDPEFNVGDYVAWEGGEGTIRSITLRVTRVQTPDGELVTVPNDVLTDQAITRPFGHGRFQIVERVEVSYDDDLAAALQQLEAAVEDVDGSLDAPDPRAYLDEFGGDGLVARVHFWIDDPDRNDVLAVRSAYARAVKGRFDDAGITVAPTEKRDLEGRIEIADVD